MQPDTSHRKSHAAEFAAIPIVARNASALDTISGAAELSHCTSFIVDRIHLPETPLARPFRGKLSHCAFRVAAHDCSRLTPELVVGDVGSLCFVSACSCICPCKCVPTLDDQQSNVVASVVML